MNIEIVEPRGRNHPGVGEVSAEALAKRKMKAMLPPVPRFAFQRINAISAHASQTGILDAVALSIDTPAGQLLIELPEVTLPPPDRSRQSHAGVRIGAVVYPAVLLAFADGSHLHAALHAASSAQSLILAVA